MVDEGELAVQLDAFLIQYPIDDRAKSYLESSPPSVIAKVLDNFKAKKEGEADYSALVISFTKRCRAGEASEAPSKEVLTVSPDELEEFRAKFPIDEEAFSYLQNSPPEVQVEVIRKFKPKRDDEDDYSALVITYTQRVRSGSRNAPPSARSAGQEQHRRPAVQYMPAAPVYYAPAPVSHRGYGAVLPRRGSLEADLQQFFRRFPCDEAAYNYVTSSPPHVQMQVLNGFTPKREGDSDYSAIVISFTKKCREKPQAAAAPHVQYPTPQMHMYPPPSQGMRRGPPAYHAEFDVDRELHAFRQRFPMDDRAFTYLCETPPDALMQMLESFVPPRHDDTDYSAPVIAFAKKCRARGGSQESVVFAKGYGHSAMGGQPFGGGQVQSRGRHRDSIEDRLDAFTRRYPVDERAFAYLSESPPDVISRVLDDFKPKREGEGDYSGAVVAFVKRCRSGGGEPKRARLGY